MMQKLTTLFFVLILSAANLYAQYRQQVGIRLGSSEQIVSTGFTYRYFLKENKAVEAIFNLRNPETQIALGGLYEIFNPFGGVENLRWYYGAGAYVGFRGFDNFGVMGIAGMDYQFAEVPVNLSVDWKPELNIIEGVTFRAATVGASVRFSFGKK